MSIIVVDKTGLIHAVAAKQSEIEWFDNYGIAPNNVSILGPKEAFTIVQVKSDAQIGMYYSDGSVTKPETVADDHVSDLVVTASDVDNEVKRRLSQGFTYDFGDSRGKHLLATTDTDMQLWNNEITPLAQANINLGDSSAKLVIYTENGSVEITSEEWFEILKALGDWRQNLYQTGFQFKSLDAIPSDYNADTHW